MRLSLFALLIPIAAASAAPVDFSRDVLPILSDKCYHCHGPDEQKREAKLRLDTKEGIYRTKDDVTVVAPGKPQESDLVVRVKSTDRDEIMPPPKANRALTPQQIATLERWVAEGAPFGKHWSFEPMKKVAPPDSGNPIDAFVSAGLRTQNLTLSPEADRERLIRRITLDLTGLPPALAEVDAFTADHSPGAYEKVVDRLLASPRFGERMATDWLDVARFADTFGYQADAAGPMWPYRDWVIKAFNENLPFDQFITWQLAGDLLPNATKEQRLATAFNRLHMQNEEGGIVEEEFRVTYNIDRVNTFGTAFLGLTFECSRCHDHKYDPITQRDFYSLFAFFQNVDEAGQKPYYAFSDALPAPTLLLSTEEQDRKLKTVREVIAAKSRELAARKHDAGPSFEEWLKTKEPLPDVMADAVAAFAFDSLEKNQTPNATDSAKPGKVRETPTLVPGKHGQAAYLDGEDGFTFPGVGHFDRADAFSLSLWLRPGAKTPHAVVLHHTKAPVDAGNRGYELDLDDGHIAFALCHMWPGNALKVSTKAVLPLNEWTHVTATYDGSSRAEGVRLYLNGVPADVDVLRDGLAKDITYHRADGEPATETKVGAKRDTEPDLTLGTRFRDSGFKQGAVDDLAVFGRALTALEVASLAGQANLGDLSQPSPLQRTQLLDFYLAKVDVSSRDLALQLHDLRDEERLLVEPIPEAMVMQELPSPKKAYILKRGAYDAHGDEVTADTPKSLPPFPANAPRNRLGLAQWLLDPEHPLTSRVTVNRLWQQMFGRGLVETAENFGTQGAQPAYPELLDWLARDFVASGWDVKATLKKIAMSATYRQSSKPSPELLARDPQNLLLARGPARRLTAEMLRDQALADSTLLVEKIGGPSVKPYQPPGLWEEIASAALKYDQGHGDNLHRRSLYTFWKRTVPPPVMMTFDAADRSNCAVRRQSTSTPLQALAMLNDVQLVEAARLTGEHMLQRGGSTLDQQVTWLFRTITGRTPHAREIAVLEQLFQEQHALFAANESAAVRLVKFGEAVSAESVHPADLAAATVLAKALFNHDEALMRR